MATFENFGSSCHFHWACQTRKKQQITQTEKVKRKHEFFRAGEKAQKVQKERNALKRSKT